MSKEILNLGFRQEGLGKLLSNLYHYEFEIDGILVHSMESFLQSLKTNDLEEKKKLYFMSGYFAWKYGQQLNWYDKQILYWNNKEYNRHSEEYKQLIEHAYDCLFDNFFFKENLKKSLDYDIDHSIGKTNPYETILTKNEYLDNLNRLRDKLRKKRFFNIFG